MPVEGDAVIALRPEYRQQEQSIETCLPANELAIAKGEQVE